MGVDKHGAGQRAANKDGIEHLSPVETIPAVQFALLARRYLRQNGLGVEAMASVAVKNHANAARREDASAVRLGWLWVMSSIYFYDLS